MKDIPGYEGLYAVTEDGRVWSYPKEWPSGNGATGKHDGKWLKPAVNSCAYLSLIICKDKKQISKLAHRLVAETYIPNPVNLPEINHKDGNKLNNHIDNLEWCSRQENVNLSILNRLSAPNKSSDYNGVYWHKATSKWMCRIKIKGGMKYLGIFQDEIESAKAWDKFLDENNIADKLRNFSKELENVA
jgi:HNH endonuclease/NUMOD4 motif